MCENNFWILIGLYRKEGQSAKSAGGRADKELWESPSGGGGAPV